MTTDLPTYLKSIAKPHVDKITEACGTRSVPLNLRIQLRQLNEFQPEDVQTGIEILHQPQTWDSLKKGICRVLSDPHLREIFNTLVHNLGLRTLKCFIDFF